MKSAAMAKFIIIVRRLEMMNNATQRIQSRKSWTKRVVEAIILNM